MPINDAIPEPLPPVAQPACRRWPGVLTSFFVPGFGLARAGRPGRAVAWFLSLNVLLVLLVGAFIWRKLPSWTVVLVFFAYAAAFLAMLVDSFRPGRLTGRMWAAFAALVVALVVLPPIPSLLAHAFTTPTSSMSPTLRGAADGIGADCFVADRLCYRISPPSRGDIVVFTTEGMDALNLRESQKYVKRIIGLPGERIAIRKGKVFANDRELGESDGIPNVEYLPAPSGRFQNARGEFEVPEDGYFVLGDNSASSADSRYWGFVPKTSIYARVARIYYPFSRVGVPR